MNASSFRTHLLLAALALIGMSCGGDDGGGPESTADAGEPVGQVGADGSTVAPPAPGAGLLVTTAGGVLEGTVANGARAFLGIPYSAPPVGDKRFAPPVRAAPWQGTRSATTLAPSCAQLKYTAAEFESNSREDCLYLNVWAPPAPSAPAAPPLPVMVWLHGGSYQIGSGGANGGEALALAGNVIVVGINYRLAAAGYFAHPALSAENGAAGAPKANAGILDQRLALEWVRDNIAAFGGDKNNVTLFGDSAGGNSICIHLASEGSRALFQRAIVQSGMCMKPALTLAEAEAMGERYAREVGCTDPATVLSCLRMKDIASIIKPPSTFTRELGGTFYRHSAASFAFQPVIDGQVVTEQLESAFAAGRIAKVPVLHGVNASEGLLFHLGIFGDRPPTTREEYLSALSARFGARATEVEARYPFAPDALSRLTNDWLFYCPAARMARHLRNAGVKSYLYRFDLPLASPPLRGLLGQAFHSSEISYIFGTDSALGKLPPENVPQSKAIAGYWTRFAATSDPNGAGAPASWPVFDQTSQHLELAQTIAPKQGFGAGCELWETLVPSAP